MGSSRRLEGKAAIVIGVSEGGIGKAVALKFASEGASVTVSSRTQSRIDKVVEEIKANGGQGIAVRADATIQDQIDHMVEETVSHYGAVDILFYNAGGGGAVGAPGDIRVEDWRAIIDQNLTGAFICSRAVLKRMMPQQSGRVIITASGTGVRPVSGDMAAYGVANAGEIALAKSLAAATTYSGITVNVICPGGVNSPEWNQVAERRFPSGVKGQPVDVMRFNQPDEVADVVLFLASYESRALTGAVIDLYFRSDMRAYSVWRESEPQYVERPPTYRW
jgi:3-oxoacyl-[acyl-carrier protein] reductase